MSGAGAPTTVLTEPGFVLEVDRTVGCGGIVCLGNQQIRAVGKFRHPAGYHPASQSHPSLDDLRPVVAVRCDIRWKVACGFPLDHEGFHPSTLTYWRRRLAVSDRPNRIFDAVRAVIAQTGVLTGKTRRALDLVVCDDAVATWRTPSPG